MSGHLYIGFDGTDLFKIGITKDYKQRRRQLRTANPYIQFVMVFPVENPAVEEIVIHTMFEKKRVVGE